VTIRAVVFDAGETLVHPTPSFPGLFARVLADHGAERSPEEVVEASTAVMHRFAEAASQGDLWTLTPEASRTFWAGVYDLMLGALAVPNTDGVHEGLHDAFTDLANYELFDDVAPVLRSLAEQGFVLGLVSNFEAWLDELLELLGVRDAFAVRVISGLEGVEKPDPAIFLRALDRLGVAPHEAVYVGDNPEFDVDPPAALGMSPVLIDRRGRHEGFDAAPRIDDLRRLPEVLGAGPASARWEPAS
jgi:putative hydrolase of the HAD superfamily